MNIRYELRSNVLEGVCCVKIKFFTKYHKQQNAEDYKTLQEELFYIYVRRNM